MAKKIGFLPKVIVVTGTPGVGKTTIARELSLFTGYEYVNGALLAEKCYVGYDKTRKTNIADVSLFTKEVIKVRDNCSKKGIIVDSHLSHHLSKDLVDACVVIVCDLHQLEKRLGKKRFDKSKTRENMDAEIFDTIFSESECHKNVFKFDSSRELGSLEDGIKNLSEKLKKI